MASLFKGTKKLPERDLKGQTVIVTGSNTGIGYEIALVLASRGAHVILGCRNTAKGDAAVQRIKDACQHGQVECWKIDQASFASVKAFVKRFEESGGELAMLILNAGLLSNLRTMTEDGFETDWQVNHLSAALLAEHFLPFLRRWAVAHPEQGPARLLITSSEAHRMVKDPNVVLNDPSGAELVKGAGGEKEAPFGPINTFVQYSKTKFAELAWFLELARREQDRGSGRVVVHCCDPGTVKSELGTKPTKTTSLAEAAAYFLAGKVIMPLIGVTPKQGAHTNLWVALSNDKDVIGDDASGGYWVGGKLAAPKREVSDQGYTAKIWAQAEAQAGIGSSLGAAAT